MNSVCFLRRNDYCKILAVLDSAHVGGIAKPPKFGVKKIFNAKAAKPTGKYPSASRI